MSFFFKKRKPSKKIKAKADGTEELVDADADVDGYDDVEDDEVVRDEVEVDDAELADDDGSMAYNKAVVYSMRDEAILAMEDKGIILSTRDVNEALAIMPKVCAIANLQTLMHTDTIQPM
jgi:hypothetical protein